jgi:hypothetical protein
MEFPSVRFRLSRQDAWPASLILRRILGNQAARGKRPGTDRMLRRIAAGQSGVNASRWC